MSEAKWYVVHTYSGYENKVKANLEKTIENNNLHHMFFDIRVPMEEVVEVKEIRLGLNIDTHDFETKGNQAKKFLTSGNKVKVSIRFRGREMAHPEHGLTTMEEFAVACQEFGVVEKPAKLEGRQMLMFLSAKPTK